MVVIKTARQTCEIKTHADRPASLTVKLSSGVVKDIVGWLCDSIRLAERQTLDYDNSAAVHFFEDPDAQHRYWLATCWAVLMCERAGVIEAGDGDGLLADAFRVMDARAQALFAYRRLKREGVEVLELDVSHHPQSRQVTDAEVIGALLAERVGAGCVWVEPIAAAWQRALDELGPFELDETERALSAAAATIRHCGDYGHLLWNAGEGHVFWVGGDADDPEQGHTPVPEIERLFADAGAEQVSVGGEGGPYDEPGWIRLPY